MAEFTLTSLLASIIEAVKLFFIHPFDGFCSLAPTPILQILYPFFSLLLIIAVVVALRMKKKPLSHIGSAVLLLLLFPPAVNFIVVMCPESDIYTLMAYGFVLVPCAPLLLYECWHDERISARLRTIYKRILATASAVMIASYSFFASVNYIHSYYATRQTENYFLSMVTQIRMTDGFSDDLPWAFVGSINDPLLSTPWDSVPVYGGNAGIKRMLNSYSRNEWITNYVGYKPTWASAAQISEIQATEEFKSMPVWPDAGSIRVISGCAVVRFE